MTSTSVARRVGGVTAGVAVAIAVSTLLSGHADAATLVTAIENPLKGVTPNFGLFGPGVQGMWLRFMAAFWAACLAICAVWVVRSSVAFGQARSRGMAAQQVDAKAGLVDSLMGLGACAAASVIIGGVLFVMSAN